MNKELDINEFVKKFLVCPSTGKIYNTPVIDKDGGIHEQAMFEQQHGDDIAYTINVFKSFINSFLDRYPEYKKQQFTIPQVDNTLHFANKIKVNEIIKNEKYSSLKSYKSFQLHIMPDDVISSLATNIDLETFKYFIDNVVDLKCIVNSNSTSNNKWHFVNYVCNRRSRFDPNIVKCLIDKDPSQMKLNCMDDGWLPLHQLLHFSSNDQLRMYAIDKHVGQGLSLYQNNRDGQSIIRFIFQQNKNIINYGLSKVNMKSIEFRDLIPTLLDALDENKNITSEEKEQYKCSLLAD